MSILDYYTINTNMMLNSHKTYEDLQKVQLARLMKILAFAYETVPYYKAMFDENNIHPNSIKCLEDLKKIPITTKSDIVKAGRMIVSTKFDTEKLQEVKTGGSTGAPLKILRSKRDLVYALASYDRARLLNGYRPWSDTLLVVGGPSHSSFKDRSWIAHLKSLIRLRHSNIGLNALSQIEEQIKLVNSGCFNTIWGYPSYLSFIATELKKRGIDRLSVKNIFTASEILDTRTRRILENFFGKTPIDVYGSWETGCIAWECSKHEGHHINTDLVVLEVVGKNGEIMTEGEGRLVVTNLTGYATPLIRYDLMDQVTISRKKCSCGLELPLMTSIKGRHDSNILLPDGSTIYPSMFTLVMNRRIPGVVQYQVIYKGGYRVMVLVISSDQKKNVSIKEKILSEFRKIFPKKMSFKINFVSNIQRSSSGKLQCVINNASTVK